MQHLKSSGAVPEAIAITHIDKDFIPTLNKCYCEINDLEEKYEQDRIVLLGRILPAVCAPLLVSGCHGVEDELTKATRAMVHQRTIPIWVVLGFQVYLDIHYIMTSEIGKSS